MRRGAKPERGDAAAARSRKSGRTTVRDLEERLSNALQREAASLEREAAAQEQLRTVSRALGEAHEQQIATSEILQIISSSPTSAQPVFEAIAESAVRLMGAAMASVYQFDGTLIHLRTLTPATWPHVDELRRQYPRSPDMALAAGRVILERRMLHLADLQTHPSTPPVTRQVAERMGLKTVLWVPMLRDGAPIGVLGVVRDVAALFSDAQVRLLQTFADQAVIAIENVRLFNETKEALEQQTATSDILRVISSSPTDLQPVFEAIVDNAMRLFRAWAVAALRSDGQRLHLIAARGGHPGTEGYLRNESPWPIGAPLPAARAVESRALVHIADIESDPTVDQELRDLARTRGWRSVLAAPMLRDGQPIGAITVTRVDAGPFSAADIGVLQTFADQAVIAIENARLLGELRARTNALTRSVEELTALGDVSRALSSTLDLETVLTTIVSRAVELSGLDGGVVFEYDDASEEFVQRVATETGGALAEARRTTRIRKGEGVLGRTAITLEPVQVPDITMPGAYESRLRDSVVDSGIRAILAVPMLRENRLIGCLVVTRNDAGEFPVNTIERLRTFATQSALAIQNARLFREIEEKSRELEAASRHKSEFLANMSHELRTPLNAIIGFSEVLADGFFGDVNEKQTEYLHDILESGRHLLSLINDILDLSKIEAGRMELEVDTFDLRQAVDNAVTLVRERASRRGVRLDQAVDRGLTTVQADERKVKQVVLNLLSNALKFTAEGGRVTVRARRVDEMAEIAVIDTGLGIAPEDQDAVFEEFRQVGTAAKRVEGTGLGLALCRKFVELHGGRIWVTSELGVGSTFTFTIPVLRPLP